MPLFDIYNRSHNVLDSSHSIKVPSVQARVCISPDVNNRRVRFIRWIVGDLMACLGQPGCCCMLASQHPGKVESQLFYSCCITAQMSLGVTTWQWRRRQRKNQVSLISLALALTASAIRHKKWGSFKFTGSFINILFPISSSHRCLFLSSCFGIKVQK